jgi:hypothetical protein
MLLLRFVIVVVIEDTVAFVDIVDRRRWRRFSEMRAMEVNNGIQIGDLDRKGARGLAVNEIPGIGRQ